MATGIQTSVHKRGRSGISGRQSSFQKEPNWKKGLNYIQGLSGKAKLMLVGGIATILLGSLLGMTTVQSNQYVELYPLTMNSEDVREVSRALINANIDHQINPTKDGILVHPSDRLPARADLAARSLPRYRPHRKDDSGVNIRTRGQLEAAERERMETDLAYTISQMEGVNDARVQIAKPPKVYFGDDNKAVTASVFLKLTYDSIEPKAIKGIASLVAHSVPELSAENVAVLDDAGFDIRETITLESTEEELEVRKEQRYRKKLQEMLAMKYGDRVHAEVNVTLDFSQEERRRYTPGDAGSGGIVEDSLQEVSESLLGAVGDKGKNYDQIKRSVNYKYSENYAAYLRKHAKIERVTASVMVDGADESEIAGITQIVKGTIGMDDARGDDVFVDVDPWDHRPSALWKNPIAPVAASVQPESAPSPLTYLAYALTFMGTCLICGFVLMKRFRPVMNVEMGGQGQFGPHGIVDQNQPKDGSFDPNQTTVNGSRVKALEGLVEHQPTKVAELLKSTWLSN